MKPSNRQFQRFEQRTGEPSTKVGERKAVFLRWQRDPQKLPTGRFWLEAVFLHWQKIPKKWPTGRFWLGVVFLHWQENLQNGEWAHHTSGEKHKYTTMSVKWSIFEGTTSST